MVTVIIHQLQYNLEYLVGHTENSSTLKFSTFKINWWEKLWVPIPANLDSKSKFLHKPKNRHHTFFMNLFIYYNEHVQISNYYFS